MCQSMRVVEEGVLFAALSTVLLLEMQYFLPVCHFVNLLLFLNYLHVCASEIANAIKYKKEVFTSF